MDDVEYVETARDRERRAKGRSEWNGKGLDGNALDIGKFVNWATKWAMMSLDLLSIGAVSPFLVFGRLLHPLRVSYKDG